MQDHTLAGLADDLQVPWSQFFPQFFQIIDKRSPTDIHLIRELISQKRSVSAHKFSEHIILSPAQRSEHAVNLTYLFIFFFIGEGVKNTKVVSSLYTLEPCSILEVHIKLFNIIADSALADRKLSGQFGNSHAGSGSKETKNACRPIVC